MSFYRDGPADQSVAIYFIDSFGRVNFRIPNYYHWFWLPWGCSFWIVRIYTPVKNFPSYDALSAGLAWSETEVFHIGRSYFDQYRKTVINHSFSCGFSLTVISEDNQFLDLNRIPINGFQENNRPVDLNPNDDLRFSIQQSTLQFRSDIHQWFFGRIINPSIATEFLSMVFGE